MEYKITFLHQDGTKEERIYTMIDMSTVRARTLYRKFLTISANKLAVNQEVFNLLEEEESLNKFMQVLLIGDHENVTWFDANQEQLDKVINDFFSLNKPKMEESKE